MIPIEGLTGSEAGDQLIADIKIMESDPDKYRAMNPENGWGSYDTFLEWLVKLGDVSFKYPKAIWSACR
jgi:hypothetical protein